jgi:hypothetical protein
LKREAEQYAGRLVARTIQRSSTGQNGAGLA